MPLLSEERPFERMEKWPPTPEGEGRTSARAGRLPLPHIGPALIRHRTYTQVNSLAPTSGILGTTSTEESDPFEKLGSTFEGGRDAFAHVPFSIATIVAITSQMIESGISIQEIPHTGVVHVIQDETLDTSFATATVITEGADAGRIPEAITSAAKDLAKTLGVYDSLVLIKRTIREVFPAGTALSVDVQEDPDEGGYPTIAFTISTSGSVERVGELDNNLQDHLFAQVPASDRLHFSFLYKFE